MVGSRKTINGIQMAKGGKRAGAGRKPGVPNKATLEIKELARQYGPKAIEELAIMAGLLKVADRKPAENDTARMAAAKEILDRGYGKAAQAIIGDENQPLKHVLEVSWAPPSK